MLLKLIVAGVVAGTASTLSQGLVWLLSGAPVVRLFLRDARLTAAVVLGRAILEETNRWLAVLFCAALVHLLLSIVFAFVIASFTASFKFVPSVLLGALIGFLLYIINLYGWTEVFPWFAESRSLNTAFAHIVFGVSAVWTYRTEMWRGWGCS